LRRAGRVAGEALVARASTGHEAEEVGGCNDGELPPTSSVGDELGRDDASALHAAGLLNSVAGSGGALVQGGRIVVGAHELIGAVGAVLDAVASLGLRDDFAVSALEAMLEAGSGDVVASSVGGGCAQGDSDQ